MNLKVNGNIVPKSGFGKIVGVSDNEVVIEFQSTLTGKIITKKFDREVADKMGMTLTDFMNKFFILVEEVK